METTDVLKQLGLTSVEAKVYLTALELGECLAGKIADSSKVYRRNVYDALEKLLELGLVSVVVKNNKKFWTATDPEKLKDMVLEKLNIVEELLPDLKSKYNKTKQKQNVRLFLGLGGMKTFFNDILKERKTLYLLGATGNIYSKLKFFAPNWIIQVNKLGIKKKYLLNFDVKEKKRHFKDFKNTDVRVLPKNFKTATQLFLYGKKSCIVVWSEEPIAVLIESNEVTNGFINYFNFMWKLSK